MIGIFDSGSGGLTVLRAMRDVLPSADVLYFGDIKNAPYGMRSREELSKLTVGAMQYLLEHGATSIVSACNSVSASLAVSLFDAFSLSPDRLIEMVGPTVRALKDSPGRAVLFATPATIDAQIYQTGFHMIGKDVAYIAIPELAGAIEMGQPAEAIGNIVRAAVDPVDWAGVDTVILACTHYPLAEESFRRVLPEHISIFDPAHAVAERAEQRLWPREAGDGKLHIVITRDSDMFRGHVARLFPDIAYSVEVLE